MKFTYDDELVRDLAKDAFGTRSAAPSNWRSMTPEAKQKWWDYANDELERVLRARAQHEARQAVDFEKRIADTIRLGARDRLNAIRWLVPTDEYGDPGFACYELDIPSQYEEEVRIAWETTPEMEKV